MYDDNRELSFVFKLGLVFLALAAIVAIGYTVAYPALLRWRTEAEQNSPQFVISGQEQITSAVEHYYSLETDILALESKNGDKQLIASMRTQQANDICEIRKTIALLKGDQYPERIPQRGLDLINSRTDVTCR